MVFIEFNQVGTFNLPIGTKSTIVFPDDDFRSVSEALSRAEIRCCDFSETINRASENDLLFVDPPYTTAHNFNGFVKYNDKIFTWEDQVRLRDCLLAARQRGAYAIMTNADHASIRGLYRHSAETYDLSRHSVISGTPDGRKPTSEAVYVIRPAA